jgi:putative addiction module component (TIGR02574 family)
MSRAEILEELRRMPEAERRELVETIEMEFGDFDDALTPEWIAELERRGEELRQHPERGIPWEQVRAEMSARYKLAPGEAELIDQRLQDHLANPNDVVPLEEVKAKLDTKYRK